MVVHRFRMPKGEIDTKQCIILDLDETLVRSFDNPEEELHPIEDQLPFKTRKRIYEIDLVDAMGPRGKGERLKMWGITRPYAKEFLKYCFKRFHLVCVWSAGKPDYVDAICQELFKDLEPPHIVYTSDHCETRKRETIKPLLKMIEMNDEHPELKGLMGLDNTFAIDDRESTFTDNVDNGILIPGWDPEFEMDKDPEHLMLFEWLQREDTTLHQLQNWLSRKEVVNSYDIRKLDKSKIFTYQMV